MGSVPLLLCFTSNGWRGGPVAENLVIHDFIANVYAIHDMDAEICTIADISANIYTIADFDVEK